MSAAKIEMTDFASINFPSKVVPIHAFEHEAIVQNQGPAHVKRKREAPASDLAKVPNPKTKISPQELALQLNALSPEEKAKVLEKLQAALGTIVKQLPELVKAITAKTNAPTNNQDANPKSGSGFDAWNHSILMLYTAFAEDQMNQNGKVMYGWEAQQVAQNQVLQEAAKQEGINANTNTKTTTGSWWKCLLVGLAVVIALIAVAAVTGGLGLIGGAAATFGAGATAAATSGITLGVAAATGIATGVTAYGASCGTGKGALTEDTTDASLLSKQGSTNTFWNTISQETNNNIQTGSQTDLVSASSNDTSLGQQASQTIQKMGQIMQTPVGR